MSQSKSESARPNPVTVTNTLYAEIVPDDSSDASLDNAPNVANADNAAHANSVNNTYTDLADGTLRRPIQCACGKRLLIRVAREGVILRCPEHGVQFRYEVDPRLIKAGRK